MITLDEALRLARAYGLSLTDVATLREMAADVAEAKHIALQLGGTDAERADEAYALEREQRDADQAAENQAYAMYREAHPTPSVAARKPVEPEYRDGMSDNDRVQAINKAHEANALAEAEEKSDEVQGRSRDFYAWTAAGKPEK